ncbi:MAG TPA: YIP1 family protein [Vicinamibacterales bacterium]|nr:YIP1 family protein [Vicinamibacterales bacterium]
MGTFVYRLMGAAMLDASVFEGIEADRPATFQALIVVLLSSVAAGIGAAGVAGPRPQTLLLVSALALLTWLAWAVLVLQIGTRYLPTPRTHADIGEMLRTIGFAAAPGMLSVFAAFSAVTVPVFVVVWAWMIAAMVVAVRQALDYSSTWRAVAVCVVALALAGAIALALAVVLERGAS